MWCLRGKDYQTGEGGKLGMSGNVWIRHGKSGLEGVKTWGAEKCSSAEERLHAFRGVGSSRAVR